MKTNVIPDVIDLDVDVRTLPGEDGDDVAAHLRAALGDSSPTASRSSVLMNDPASISRTDTPLWDALHRAITVPFPDARLTPQFSVGFTDARVFRELGAISYGAGLFSPSRRPGRVRTPLPRPRRARRRRVAAPHHRAVGTRRARSARLTCPT